MSGLILKLGPNERVLINGAVIENGDRRTKFAIKTPNAHVLRLKDAIHPEKATTPISRTCYIAQLILSGDTPPEEGQQQLIGAIDQLSQVFDDAESRHLLATVTQHVIKGDAYRALRRLRQLLPLESKMLAAGIKDTA